MPLSATLSATSQHQAQKSRHVAGSGGAAVAGIDVLHALMARPFWKMSTMVDILNNHPKAMFAR